MLTVDVQFACKNTSDLPEISDFERWVNVVLDATGKKGSHAQPIEIEVSIRIVDEHESEQLNTQYRGKNAPTNVLSFPCELPPEVEHPLLGDLVICKEVVEKEAIAQNKPLNSHWAHMVIHGVLHLLGYDHIDDNDANEMEAIEINILATLRVANPYLHHQPTASNGEIR